MRTINSQVIGRRPASASAAEAPYKQLARPSGGAFTIREFCADNRISVSSFYKMIRRWARAQ
jgi:hypothetical protein